MKTKQTTRFLSFLFLVFFICTGYAQKYSEHYYKLSNQFKEEANTENEIIFLGNSITEGGQWKTLFPKINVINRGISGDVTHGIIDRLEEITSSNPKKVFLLIGINDLARGKTVSYILSGIDSIVKRIKFDSPSTQLYLQTILPVNPYVGDGFKGHKSRINEILSVNIGLVNIAKKYKTHIIDLHGAFLDKEGYLKKRYTHDGLHLQIKGYKKWKRVINRYVKE